MAIDQAKQDQQTDVPAPDYTPRQENVTAPDEKDGLEGKKPEELTAEELRLMADTMPGEGPGDD